MDSTLNLTQKTHIVWLDVVRLVAMFTVVCCHSADPFNFYPGEPPANIAEIKWWGAVYGSLLRPCVPLFVMITGALLLPVKGEVAPFYRKRIGRVFWPFLGLDPVGLKDEYCPSYFHEMRNLTLVNRAYCIRNPKHYKGFGPDCWGLTASYSVNGYAAHSPNEQEDKGVISPTAALSSIVYTPEYSMQVMRHLYGMGDKVFGPFGFYDAFSETDNWYPQRYLAIDQGPIAVMIENYRSGLLWKLFMSHPDVQAGLTKLGFNTNKQDVRQK